jgi:hypothetical protein
LTGFACFQSVAVTVLLTFVSEYETLIGMIPFWRLSEAGEDNLGLACTDDGLRLGRTPLIERRDRRFAVRDRSEIERLLKRAYGTGAAVDRIMPGLATVAAALNADDQCLARIAAVHLRIPDLPSHGVRSAMEAEDVLIKSADWNPDLHPRTGAPPNPGWFAATGGSGVEASPIQTAANDDPTRQSDATPGASENPAAALTSAIEKNISRREFRNNVAAALQIGLEALANAIPGVDLPAYVAMATAIAQMLWEHERLAIDAAAALEFAKKGPRRLEDLQVSSSGYEQFSSYEQFVKAELSQELMMKRFGGAGAGNQYHHIVTQGGLNGENIPPQLLQNTNNIVILPTLLHELVTDEYLQPAPDGSNRTLYQWLQTQPYNVQREEGLKILRQLGILK